MATVFRGALVAPSWRQAFIAAAIAPNLLCGPLGGAAPAAPVAQSDWRVPTARVYPTSLRTWNGCTPLQLIGKDQFFGAPGQPPQYDQQLPPRGPPRIQQTWSQNLLQTTLTPAPIVNVPTADVFDLPPPAPQFVRTWTTNLLLTTLAPVGPAPFSQSDWPVPRSTWYSISLRTWSSSSPLNLLGQDTFFGGPGRPPAQPDWPLPRAVAPLPRGAIGNLLETTLAPAAQAPFVPADWKLPWRAARNEQSWSSNLLETVLAPGGPMPFAQTKWPVPTAAPRMPQGWLLQTNFYFPAPVFLQGGPRYIVKRDRARPFTVARMRGRTFTVSAVSERLEVLGPQEKYPLTFDFSIDLDPGETLVGPPTVLSIVTSLGVDINPSAIQNGAAALDATQTKVILPAKGGLDGCEYDITVECPTSNPLKVLTLIGTLPVRVKNT